MDNTLSKLAYLLCSSHDFNIAFSNVMLKNCYKTYSRLYFDPVYA